VNTEILNKYGKLLDIIRPYGKAVIAFSGGVDSTLLAYAASEALGRDNAICVTARSLSFPERERKEGEEFCLTQGIRHVIIDFDELGVDGFAANPPDRCYICKHALFSLLRAFAEEEGIKAIFEGSNVDDSYDYRPGLKAVRELGAISPLQEAGLTKEEIREILKGLGLSAWDKPPLACLATRIPHGEEITAEKLIMADKAEQVLFERGYRQARVRVHGDGFLAARIEVEAEEIERLASGPERHAIGEHFKGLGFKWVSLDLTGYRTGSMSEPGGS